jgi:hypothetical protein
MKRLLYSLIAALILLGGSYGLAGAVSTFIVPQGGTGQTSFTAGNLLYGSGTGSLQNTGTTTLLAGSNITLSGTPVILGLTPITISASGGGGSGSVSTSTNEVANQIAVFSSNSATPALIAGNNRFTWNPAVGGAFLVNLSANTGSGTGGSATVKAGGGGPTNGAGGILDLESGSGFGSGNGGTIFLANGPSGTGMAGTINIGGSTNTAGYWGNIFLEGSTSVQDAFTLKNATFDTSKLASSDKTFTFPNITGYFGVGTPVASQLTYWGSDKSLSNVATTTATCSGSASCTAFTIIGSSPVTISASGGGSGSGNVATSTHEVVNQIPFFTSNSATPALIGGSADFSWDNKNSILSIGTSTLNFPAIYLGGGGAVSAFGDGTELDLDGAAATSTGTGGGRVLLSAGVGSTTGTGGAITVNAGNGSTNASNGTGNGGSVTLTSGNGGQNGNTSGGNIQLTPGLGHSAGIRGFIQFIKDTSNSSIRDNLDLAQLTGIQTISSPNVTGTIGVGVATTSGNLSYWGASGGLYAVATSTLTASAPLTGSFTQVGSGGSLGCTTASSGVTGCLSGTDWNTFNNKGSGSVTSITLGGGLDGLSPITTTGTITAQVSTSTVPNVGGLAYWTGNTTPSSLGTVATSSLSAGTGLTGSFTYVGSGGSLALSVPVSIANGGTNNTSAYTAGSVIFSDGTKLNQNNANFFWDNNVVGHGIGTSTPRWTLEIASSTNSQLALSDTVAADNEWTFSGQKSLYIGTSSPTTFATSSMPALTINNNGYVGIGTSSPFAPFSTVGSEQHYGNYFHFGSAVPNSQCNTVGGSATCLELVGNDNTIGGVETYVVNTNNGSSAYSGDVLLNSLVGTATTNHAGIFLNSPEYSDTTFGTLNAVPNLVQFGNSMGPTSIQSFASTSAASYINFFAGSTTPGAGPAASGEGARLTTNGFGIGTTSPGWALEVASSTRPQLSLYDTINSPWSFYGGKTFYLSTSTAATSATSTTAALQLDSNGFLTLPAIAAASGTNCLQVSTSGKITNTGSACGSGGGSSFGYPFTSTPVFNQTTAATTTLLALTASPVSLAASSTAWFDQINVGSTTANTTSTSTFYGNVNIVGSASSTKFYASTGTAASPSYTFASAPGYGMYWSGASAVNFSVAGIVTTEATNDGLQAIDGSAALPSLSFISHGTTGLFAGTNQLGITTNGTEAARFDNVQRFGLGTTTPFWQFQLASATPAIDLDNTSAGTNAKHLLLGWNAGLFTIGTSSDALTSTSTALSLNPIGAGIVGIGTTTPFAKLSVEANPYDTFTPLSTLFAVGSTTNSATTTLFAVNNDGSIIAPNTTSSGANQTGYWCYDAKGQLIRDTTVCLVSALKFKKDIVPLTPTYGLSAVLQMKPITYFLKVPLGKEDAGQQIGFVADWSEKIVPQLVTHDSNGDVHGFNYEQYTAVLTEGMQEFYVKFQALVARVSGLEKRVNAQQKEIDQLQAEVKALQK